MTEPAFKSQSIRSPKYLAGAKDQPCTLRFLGVCLDPYGQGHETTVFAHFRFGKGMGIKADDIDGCDSCAACHRFLDEGWSGKISQTILLRHMADAKCRTQRNRFERGILFVTQPAKSSGRKSKPRTKGNSRPIPKSQNAWPKGRKLATRPLRRKEST